MSGGATIRNCLVVKNFAVTYGGGLFIEWGELLIEHSTFVENEASFGAAICSRGSTTVVLRDCAFLSNTASAGGGIQTFDATDLVAIGCTIRGNTATGSCGGGVVIGSNRGNVVEFWNCRILENQASFCGGGILNVQTSTTMVNCVVSGNSSNRGGGIYNGDADLLLVNSTIAFNAGNGGVMVANSQTNFENCIVRENDGGAIIPDFGFSPGSIDVMFSNIEGGWAGTGNIDADPLFVQPLNHNFRLQYGSPCLDAGDVSLLPTDEFDVDNDGNVFEVLPIDLMGIARVLGSSVDMGANEGAYDWEPPTAMAEYVGPGELELLVPMGQLSSLVEDSLGFMVNKGDDYIVLAQLTEEDIVGPEGSQKLMTFDATADEGEFDLRLSVAFEFDLATTDPARFDLMRFDDATGRWRLAVSTNTAMSPGHGGPVGDRIVVAAPDPIQTTQDLGDYGVYYDRAIGKGFYWANVDRTGLFAHGPHVCREGATPPVGVVDADDLFAVLGNWGACPQPCMPTCAGDVNGDCVVNVMDMLAVLRHWGLCD